MTSRTAASRNPSTFFELFFAKSPEPDDGPRTTILTYAIPPSPLAVDPGSPQRRLRRDRRPLPRRRAELLHRRPRPRSDLPRRPTHSSRLQDAPGHGGEDDYRLA